MEESVLKACPQCEYPYGYAMNDEKYVCPDCNFEWNPNESQESVLVVKDANGNTLNSRPL